MEKEYIEQLTRSPSQKIESQKFELQKLEDIESEDGVYQWFESYAMQHPKDVKIGKDETGTEYARITKINIKTQQEEIIYYTVDKTEVQNLKSIIEGEPLKTEVSIECIRP